ncbi:MAG TPA: ABC transporter permease [Candidatus Acidoferrales bacterium]|jgi:putative ABC transport system permease protein|nr:ABC transporter permease [Candidatus Acidoferrales bacterium]
MKSVRSLIRNLFRRGRVERDLDAEVRGYAALLEEEKMREGMNPNEAKRSARIEMGGPEQVKEEVRAARAGAWLETFWQDIRFAARTLRKNPGFTAVAVLTLALGIGANTAIFSVVKTVLLDPLPYRQPNRLVKLAAGVRKQTDPETVSYLLVQDWKERTHSFKSIALYGLLTPTMTGEGRAQILRGMRVSYDFFDTLGVSVALGRGFEKEDDRPDRRQVVLLSYGFWKEKFGGRPDVVGKSITMNQLSFQIIGVLPPNFDPLIFNFFPDPPEVWVPFGYTASTPTACRGCRNLRSIARLADGVSIEQARKELTSIMPGLERDYSDSYPPGLDAVITPLDKAVVGQAHQVVWILFGVTGFVLLIACINTASLLLSRSAVRRREIALRLALGGSRTRLVRQFITETTVLTLLGGAAGLAIASIALKVFLHWAPTDVPRLEDIHLDFGIYLFAFAASVAVGLIVGLVPAWAASRIDQRESLQHGVRTTSSRFHRRTRNSLVICEVALAFVLTLATGLLLRSMQKLLNVNPGFQSDHVFTTNMGLVGPNYSQPASVAEFDRQVVDRLKAVRGIEAAAIVSTMPLSGSHDRRGFHIQDRPLASASSAPFLDCYFVSPDYFHAMEIPLQQGRLFTDADVTPTSAPVAIISQLTAHQMWPGEDVLGKHIQVGTRNDAAPWATIVGVVGDIRQYGLDSTPTAEVYLTFSQAPLTFPTIVILSKDSPNELERVVEEEVAGLDKNVPVFVPATMNELIAQSVAQRRFVTELVVCFGALALILSCIGIYGLMTYQISQRTNEIGIRMALGAHPATIFRLIASENMVAVLLGIGAGAVSALAFGHVLASQLYGVRPTDALAFLGTSAVLLLTAFLTCYIPARRAMRVDPIVALRHE